ncbi:MAG: methyltransferase domain-containing protein [Desulfobacteraceae bacterium]|nr:MAG: methyltransferase domain-containing protein [Desulfobacteraceae bacterium]
MIKAPKNIMNPYLEQELSRSRDNGYLQYHAPRYDRLLSLLLKYYSKDLRVLDIGRSPFTRIAADTIKSDIDTLGFEADKQTDTGYNYQYDLNHAQQEDTYRKDLPAYDIIIFAEVIEHLHTSPALVLNFLKTLLTDNGIIILQTPNAAVLHKRVQFLLGSHPFSLISENLEHPSHFREYTLDELINYGRNLGFTIVEKGHENYFDYRYSLLNNGTFSFRKRRGLLNSFYRLVPAGGKPGLCMVLRLDKICR